MADTEKPYITLAQFCKIVGAAESGGQAKHLVREGAILVNGEKENRPGRKLHTNDIVTIAGERHQVTIGDEAAE
jgi:ribosome-associated protein